jgi:hypothetical protein
MTIMTSDLHLVGDGKHVAPTQWPACNTLTNALGGPSISSFRLDLGLMPLEMLMLLANENGNNGNGNNKGALSSDHFLTLINSILMPLLPISHAVGTIDAVIDACNAQKVLSTEVLWLAFNTAAYAILRGKMRSSGRGEDSGKGGDWGGGGGEGGRKEEGKHPNRTVRPGGSTPPCVMLMEITFMDTEDEYKKIGYLKITKVHIFKSIKVFNFFLGLA